MKKLLFLIMFLFIFKIGRSQITVEKEYNLPRVQDYLTKQQVQFTSPGDSGENQFWNFSNLKVIDEKYRITYTEYPDSLLIARELRSLYKYTLKGDTLVSTGMENVGTLVEYSSPELQLIYPVSYNDKNEGYFQGKGDYCKQIDLEISGKAYYHADGYGSMLLPDGDTLKHVLRIKHTKKQIEDQYNPLTSSDSLLCSPNNIEYRLANDTLWTQTETYKWYAQGYRYPVFESIEYYVHYNGNTALKAMTSFYYPPDEQYYGLEDDPENREKREWLAMQEAENNTKKSKKKADKINNLEKNLLTDVQSSFSYTIHQDRQGETLIVEYTIEDPQEVAIALFDTQGRVLIQRSPIFRESGAYREDFLLNDYIKGEYLLRIITTEESYTEKIMH